MARVFVGMFAFLCLTASPAEAGDLWAWIKELSGPGPFHGKQFDVRLACVGSVKPSSAYTGASHDRAVLAEKEDFVPASGVFYSFCRGPRANAPIAIGATFRSVHNSPTGPEDYAGGNQINLTTIGATLTWRPFNSFKNPKLDVLDIGMAINRYSFTSHGESPGGFATLSGVMIEPVRLELHAPSSIRNDKTWWWLSVPFVQFSWVIFPEGFGPNAFGPDLVGEKAQRLPAEWVPAGNIFFDLTPVAFWIGKYFQK